MKRIFLGLMSLILCAIVFQTGALVFAIVEDKNAEYDLPIIMYHHILKEKSKLGKFIISPDEFEADLKYLKENGYQTITAEALIRYKEEGEALPEKPVMITFDDGHLSYLEYAVPLLEKYDMCAVVSVVGAYLDEYTKTKDRCISYAYLNWEDVKALGSSAHTEIQNHTYNMHKISNGRSGCSKMRGEDGDKYREIFKEDVKKMRDLIYENTGKNADCFTYPFGFMCKEAEEEIKKMGFRMSLSCREEINRINRESSLFKLARYNREHKRSVERILGKKGQ